MSKHEHHLGNSEFLTKTWTGSANAKMSPSL